MPEQWTASSMGRKGGKSRSDKKAAAVRENGKLGGWTRTKKRQAIEVAKNACDAPRDALQGICEQLESAGAVTDARALGKVIAKLEAWQEKNR